jgi:hypothetical protein
MLRREKHQGLSQQTSDQVIPKFNIDLGAGSYYLDRLIEEEKKSEGR